MLPGDIPPVSHIWSTTDQTLHDTCMYMWVDGWVHMYVYICECLVCNFGILWFSFDSWAVLQPPEAFLPWLLTV